MTQDQRNSFVKLVEQIRSQFSSRRCGNFDERQAAEEVEKKELAGKFSLAAAEKKFAQARAAEDAARQDVRDIEAKIDAELRKGLRAENAKIEKELEVFTLATAEVLALEDAKDAQKVIERLSAL